MALTMKFTKEQYLDWLRTRGPVSTWKHEHCVAADALIKKATLERANAWIKANIGHCPAATLLEGTIRAHFGSVEIDTFLMSIDAYPDWMER